MLRHRTQGRKPNRKPLRANLRAILRYDDQAKVYTGYAPGLKIYSQATTEEHAKRILARAAELLITAAQRNPALADSLPDATCIPVAKANHLEWLCQ